MESDLGPPAVPAQNDFLDGNYFNVEEKSMGEKPLSKTQSAVELESHFVARNYHPLPVVLESGEGCWVTDVDGRRYFDGLAGYSAVNFGHSNPQIVDAAAAQIAKLGVVSRAFHSANLGPFCEALADLTGMDTVVPMNTGAEAVETAIKAARKWGYVVKGVSDGDAEVIVMGGNFHGRTTTIVSFSDDPDARDGYGPYTPGFVIVPFGDVEAVKAAITPNTVAVLTEPIQGEGGVIIPPEAFLPELRSLCDEENVLLVVDEIQSGFGRTGATFACDLAGIKPDLYTLGKALGGGVYPVSAVAGRKGVLDVFTPGTHGSTFGGNPVGAAIGIKVVEITKSGVFQRNAVERGQQVRACLEDLRGRFPGVIGDFRQIGLWVGIDLNPQVVTGRGFCELMQEEGVLLKDAHDSVVRVSPPLTATRSDIDFLCEAIETVVGGLADVASKG